MLETHPPKKLKDREYNDLTFPNDFEPPSFDLDENVKANLPLAPTPKQEQHPAPARGRSSLPSPHLFQVLSELDRLRKRGEIKAGHF